MLAIKIGNCQRRPAGLLPVEACQNQPTSIVSKSVAKSMHVVVVRVVTVVVFSKDSFVSVTVMVAVVLPIVHVVVHSHL